MDGDLLGEIKRVINMGSDLVIYFEQNKSYLKLLRPGNTDWNNPLTRTKNPNLSLAAYTYVIKVEKLIRMRQTGNYLWIKMCCPCSKS